MGNIFNGVSSGNENAASELLVNLMKVAYIKDLICRSLGIDEAVYQGIRSDDIRTQIGYEAIGRPDIIIENNDCLVFIENKILLHTDMQESQTTSYLAKLKDSNKRYNKMIYLVPEQYRHKHTLDAVAAKNNFCIVKTWEELLGSLYEKELYAWNDVVAQSLSHLSELALQQDVSLTLSREEIIMMMQPREVVAALTLIEKSKTFSKKVVEQAVLRLGKGYARGRKSEGDKENGIYINYKNKDCLFLGFNLGLPYPECNDFFYALDVLKDAVNVSKKEEYTKNNYSDDEWLYIKLDKSKYTDFENPEPLVEDIVRIIVDVIRK